MDVLECSLGLDIMYMLDRNDSWPAACSGYGAKEPGAVVCRVAPSFVRFGTFQLPVSRDPDQHHLTRKLADYVIKHHFTHLQGTHCTRTRPPAHLSSPCWLMNHWLMNHG